jgi:polynucleotide 5'-hydroxyl-kinase GRC3/NOL9
MKGNSGDGMASKSNRVSVTIAGQTESILVSEPWTALDLETLEGVILVVGAPDTGKSTFVRWLFDQLCQRQERVALLDGDVGQNALGPPTTLTLLMPAGDGTFRHAHWFVGDVSPRGHMLPLVVGAGRLVRRALEAGIRSLVVNTTGLVDRSQGGVALKHALLDELQPATVVGIQRGDELAPLLAPLRHLSRPQLIQLPVSPAVRTKDRKTRQANRARRFRHYFDGAAVRRLSLRGRAVFEGRTFAPRRLLALQDLDGFALALGVVTEYREPVDELALRTPLSDLDQVASVHLGAIGVDVKTGEDFRPGKRA